MRRVGPAVVALLGRPVRVAVAAPDTFESSVGGIVRRGSTRLSGRSGKRQHRLLNCVFKPWRLPRPYDETPARVELTERDAFAFEQGLLQQCMFSRRDIRSAFELSETSN